jgi:transposase
MSKTQRKKYSNEFKAEAVKLVTDQGYSYAEAAKNLGINDNMLRRWSQQLSEKGQDAFPGNGKKLGMEEELRRLREENRRLKMEREILKKATAFFAKEAG